MSTSFDDSIANRIDFLRQQLSGEDDPAYIRTFKVQINILVNAQLDRLDELIEVRRKDLQSCNNAIEADRIFAEIEALEWLQRQSRR